MLSLPRPDEPPSFDADTREAKATIQKIIDAGGNPGSKQFKDVWKRYKHLFFEAQHSKCGYCESRISQDHGDVEHYAPKAEIERIAEERWGTELDGKTVTHGTALHRPRGYYWRAYDWNNYLLACTFCNRRHKRALFPVQDRADDDPNFPNPDIEVEALLLNPFEPDLDPSAHLRFNEEGLVFAHSKGTRGWHTIRVVRLDRVKLCEDRRDRAQRAVRCFRQIHYGCHYDNEHELQTGLSELAMLGADDAPYAEMVRIMAKHELRLSWGRLMALRTS